MVNVCVCVYIYTAHAYHRESAKSVAFMLAAVLMWPRIVAQAYPIVCAQLQSSPVLEFHVFHGCG